MKRSRKNYSPEFKAKVVLELLQENKTINEIASKYGILPKSLIEWKKQFLENAALAFDKSSVVKEYKQEIENLEEENEKLAKKLGKVIVERDWLQGKLKSLDLLIRKTLIDNSEGVQAKTQKNPSLSLNRQLELLSISKTAYYYTKKEPFSSEEDKILLDAIDKIYTEHPYYGARRMQKALEIIEIKVGKRKLSRIYKFMGIRALYPPPKTTILNKENKKYPYLLEQTTTTQKPNQIWSGDITYIKLEKGYAYLATIIDWHSKKVLSWKLSNTMDSYLTTSILEEAIEKYGRPEIFNSDQGSQYTSKEHIEILEKNGIKISMNAKGRSIDNIVIERFWRTLKYENVYLKGYSTIKEAREGINQYIEIYNSQRIHSSIGYKTPDMVYYNLSDEMLGSKIKDLLKAA